MKTWLLIPIPVVALLVGLKRQSELGDLDRENERLESLSIASSQTRSSAGTRGVSLTEAREAALQFRELTRNYPESPSERETAKALRKKLRDGLAGRSVEEVRRFLDVITEGLDEKERDALNQDCIEAFAEIDPASALKLTLELPNRPDLRNTLLRCIPVDPELAVKVFDQLVSEDSPLIRDHQIIEECFAAQARIDPRTFVSRLLSPEGTRMTDDVRGGWSRELRTPQEHHAYLTALRIEGSSHAGTLRLESLRSSFISTLRNEIPEWPVADSIELIDAEFTTKEKQRVFNSLISMEDPVKLGQWADWMGGLEKEAGREHVIGEFMRKWLELDSGAAKTWLDAQPESAMRTAAAKTYAMNVASKDPLVAAEVALTLPQGKDRSHALAVVRDEWKKKDPAGYLAFAEKQGLKK